jgi:GDP-D-mannose 3', 5'-epimerase
MKTALVCGAGGFIGSHLVKRLKEEGYWVRGVDLKYPEFSKTYADEFFQLDLRSARNCLTSLTLNSVSTPFDDVYQLAADMGGAGFVFTGENDLDIMHNSAMINLNFANYSNKYRKIFYSSSACAYPEYNQLDPKNPLCSEDSVYPANPDSEYGWEKVFSERIYLAVMRNRGVPVRIARFHNIFGPEGTWEGGREKAPAAFCRKIAEVKDGAEIEMWGDGEQTRSFLYIDECLEGIIRLMNSDFVGPVNIGSEEIVTINQLASYISEIANKKITIKHIEGPLGVRGRNSDNKLIKKQIGWEPNFSLREGLSVTYPWIEEQYKKKYIDSWEPNVTLKEGQYRKKNL